jgi:CRP-like cAMP-binding protein
MEHFMSLNKNTLRELSTRLGSIPLYRNIKGSKVLKELDFFSDVSDEILEDITDSVMISEFITDDIICRHGMFDERFYIILSGSVKAVIPTVNDPKFELFDLKPGDFFGEEIIFSADPRENTIIANENTMTISLPREVLRRLISSSNNIKSLMDQRYIERKLKIDLRRVPLFTHLNDDLFSEILNRVVLISVPEGEVIFKEGDQGDDFFLIRDGEVNVYRNVGDEKRIVALLSEGQFFGEMALLSDETRNATIEASRQTDLVKLSRNDFLDIVKRDKVMVKELSKIIEQRKRNREDILNNPNIAIITKKLLDTNREINKHLNIISQCTVDTDVGSALLATLPGSRYPYVYPRDSACASRFLYKLVISPIKAGDIAFRLLGGIARFILHCQREDGYWGQRYGIKGEDKGIYKQEDNVSHGVIILCRYLLAAVRRNVEIRDLVSYIDAIDKGAEFARKHYYRNEIHLFYSTTSIHESAIEEGYSIWVNYAYLLMLRLIERIGNEYGVGDRFPEEMELKKGFESTIDNVFALSDRYVRRLKPDGVVDLRPDITLMSPYFFGTGMDVNYFNDNEVFKNSISFIEQQLWDPDLGMLQRYLPFIEDPHTHIHAGNGPWLQYTSMLAQYYYYTGDLEKGDSILEIVEKYSSREGYLCEHFTTPERFYEFKRLEWLSGMDFEKEFAQDILVPGITYDLIVEELNHMKNSYDDVERKIKEIGDNRYISFATPLMWSHAEYAMALLFRSEAELKDY